MASVRWEQVKPTAGVILIAVGSVLFCDNVDRVATQFHALLSGCSGESLGALRFIMAATRLAHAYAANRQQFIDGLMVNAFVSSCPLLPVALGAIWFGEASANQPARRKDGGIVDLVGGATTSK